MIGVVIPTLNQQALAYEALASILTDHQWQPIIIPNWRNGWPVAKSWNHGYREAISKADADYIVFLNDDILIAPYSLDNMVMWLDDTDHLLVTARNKRGEILPQDIWTYENETDDPQFVEAPDYSCFMVRRGFFGEVGSFDENFRPAYFEDNDSHRRINLSGKKAINVSDAAFYHYGSKTQNANPSAPVADPSRFELNREYYVRKWGGPPGQEIFQTPYNDPALTYKDWL